MSGKVKFGIRLAVQGEMGATSAGFTYALEMAQIAEDLGFDSVWIPDHVENAHLDRSKPILEYWTAMSAIGALTKRVRLGGHSINNTFRHPGLTAKIVCTLDEITGGRVILAPGSGWFATEAKSYGFTEWSDDGLTRIARLDECLSIIRGLITNEEPEGFSFSGEFYNLKDAFCNPKPPQKPYPPIWIAGDSPPTQELMVKHGDVWFMYSKAPAIVAELIKGMKEKLTDRAWETAISTVGLTGTSEAETLKWAEMYAEERKHRFPIPPTVDDILQSNLYGDVGQVCGRIDEWIDAGVTNIVIQPMPPMDGMRFFGEKIIHRYS
ncbi:LLM class flavin-dependent oxidoreductase [Thalassospiraceae bacterium LMO-JJ14]|nr:LLM class flavin-dependent oxidoreductase [Thalassospiraceae bacterium LMO-JJ14]